MGRPRKQPRPKEPVKIRQRQLKDGNTSLYLDIYVEGERHYEFLKLYLVPEIDAASKIRNSETIRAATAIKSARILELTQRKAGVNNGTRGDNLTFAELSSAYLAKQERRGRNVHQLKFALRHVGGVLSPTTKLMQIDRSLCLAVVEHLKCSSLKVNSARHVVEQLNALFNDAVRHELMLRNPFKQLDRADNIKAEPTERVFLTADEVQRLEKTPYRKDHIKRAFLFSCFCGLRFSDVSALKWGDITTNGIATIAQLKMQKTQTPIALPLSKRALSWLPEREERDADNKTVFPKMRVSNVDRDLLKWMQDAGITKRVSFHSARHTFATLLLTYGTDLYTVSKLLGHTNIKTTQIYAKVIDEKKAEAVNLLNGIGKP